MQKALLVAYASPASPEQDKEFNTWYEDTHIGEVMAAVPQITGATRYRLVDPQAAPGSTRYLCVYEIDADDVMEAAAALGAAAGSLTLTESMDVATDPPVLHWAQQT